MSLQKLHRGSLNVTSRFAMAILYRLYTLCEVSQQYLCFLYTLSLLGNVYGRGVYFARDASGAANDRYSPRDTNNHKHMYLARVLVGEYTVGMRDLIVPPPKDPTNPAILYDSVVDNQEHPRVFCIFQDSQVYPDYHIEFS